ncbi:MAG: hypothetical protein QOF78_2709 [Phycisphaerales bacterium]|jgi:hypothetical protein|nr:hypothetical protein [Phycisphaerales bacterium]
MTRTEFGFARTSCACRRCTISCEHVPGALAPADLPRLAAHLGYADVLGFARDNLLASEGVQVTTDQGKLVTLPTLVPATQPNGHCKFLKSGRCEIHAVSPFGCAFIDAHQSDADYAVRADALYRDLYQDRQTNGPYAQAWADLSARGMLAPPLQTRQYRLNKAMRREKLA